MNEDIDIDFTGIAIFQNPERGRTPLAILFLELRRTHFFQAEWLRHIITS